MKAWIAPSLAVIAVACGGTFIDQASNQSPNIDGGSNGGSSMGGSPNAGGGQQTGGRLSGRGGSVGAGGAVAAGGLVGAGGGIVPPPGGFPGTGGLDCSNVGCGMAPVCGEPCGAPCGCCGCPDGAHQDIGGVDHICNGGCWAPGGGSTDAGSPTCSYNGQSYDEGDRFRAGDGCNTCSCSAGNVACTQMACSCDPATETHQREYVATDPQQCLLLDIACQPNTTLFQNSCGCGCEQGVDCPDWFDCMPGSVPGCDVDQIKVKCPYSGIAF
jgi:hypothetical protein